MRRDIYGDPADTSICNDAHGGSVDDGNVDNDGDDGNVDVGCQRRTRSRHSR